MNRKEAKKVLGERVREMRVARGVSRQQLADKCGAADHGHISRIENGITLASVVVYLKIADLFEVSYDVMFHGLSDDLLPRPDGGPAHASGKD